MDRLKIKKSLFEKTNPRSPLLISVISGKGGVGKSVLAYNLAYQIAHSNSRVLIVDADSHFGNQHILANANADCGLNEVVGESLSLKEATITLNENLDMLASPHRLNPFEEDKIAELASFVNLLRQNNEFYDVVIIDHASGMSKQSATIAYASDVSLIVIIPELSSISDGYGLFKYLKSSDATIDCRLLLNRTTGKEEAEYIFSKFCAISDRFLSEVPELAGFISEDDSIRQALATQQPLAETNSESIALAQINLLASNILSNLANSHLVDRKSPQTGINKTAAYADIKE